LRRSPKPGAFLAVLAEKNFVPDLDIWCADLTVVQDLALSDGNDFSEDRLLGGVVRDHDSSRGFSLFGFASHDQSVIQWSDSDLP
jgi:hypothetical protein